MLAVGPNGVGVVPNPGRNLPHRPQKMEPNCRMLETLLW